MPVESDGGDMDRRQKDPDEIACSPRKWHFDKTLNVGTITAIFVAATIVGAYVQRQDARLTTIEVRMDSQSQAMVTIASGMRDATRDLQVEVRQLRADMMQFLRDANRRASERAE